MTDDILVASRTGYVLVDGQQVVVRKGMTTARAGHPVIEAGGDLWVPLVPDFEVDEPAAAEPGKPARASSRRAAATGE